MKVQIIEVKIISHVIYWCALNLPGANHLTKKQAMLALWRSLGWKLRWQKMYTNHLHSTKMCSNEDEVIVYMQFLTSLLICTFSCHCWCLLCRGLKFMKFLGNFLKIAIWGIFWAKFHKLFIFYQWHMQYIYKVQYS